MSDGSYVVLWAEPDAYGYLTQRLQRYSQDGAPLSGEVAIGAAFYLYGGGFDRALLAAYDGGYALWDVTGVDFNLRRYNNDGSVDFHLELSHLA